MVIANWFEVGNVDAMLAKTPEMNAGLRPETLVPLDTCFSAT
jgi:hypothetical protein